MSTTVHTPWRRLVGVVVALGALLTALALAFLWPAVTSEPRDLPVAVVGPAAVTEPFVAGLEAQAPGVFDVVAAADRDAAVDLVEARDVYGAIVLGAQPEVLTSSAGSSIVAQQLTALAPVLEDQAGAATGQDVEVPVTDVVPLSADDPRGAVLGAIGFPLVIGGMVGGIAVSFLVVGVRRRVAAVVGYAALGGLALAGVLHGWFGALVGSFWTEAGIISLTILAIGGLIVGAASLVGRAGVAVGPVLFLLVANPLSSAAAPWQMLPSPWGMVGQLMPPGAAAALLRDESYFPAADTTSRWVALVAWVALAMVLITVGHFRESGAASRAALAEAVPDGGRHDEDDVRSATDRDELATV